SVTYTAKPRSMLGRYRQTIRLLLSCSSAGSWADGRCGGEAVRVEALDIENRIQHEAFIRKYMPFETAARLPVDVALKGLTPAANKALERSYKSAATKRAMQHSHLPRAISGFLSLNKSEIPIAIGSADKHLNFLLSKIRDPVKTWK